MSGVSLCFEGGYVGAGELEPVVRQAVLDGLREHQRDQDRAGDVIDLTSDGAVLDLNGRLVEVRESAQGADPTAIQIVIAFAGGMSTELVMDLLRRYVYPALEDAFGHKPLGRHVADISGDGIATGGSEHPGAGRHVQDR